MNKEKYEKILSSVVDTGSLIEADKLSNPQFIELREKVEILHAIIWTHSKGASK